MNQNGDTYVITIADWDVLSRIYETNFVGKEQTFADSYNAAADRYLYDHAGASEATATEYALMGN